MATNWNRRTVAGVIALAAAVSAGCGDVVRQGRSPVQLVILTLEAASGATPDEFGATLLSDVLTNASSFNDLGQATFSLILKDPGQPGIAATPSAMNQVTITRYRVEYVRTDGNNTQGVDVPFSFDSAVTVTVPAVGTASTGFDIVRHTAKREPPLAQLAINLDIISTIARVTFYGRDQAGNDVTATGQIGVNFANFADPE